MYKDSRIAVVIPAYNEESQITQVLKALPEWIDRVFVVDDASTDDTAQTVKTFVEQNEERFGLVSHKQNSGVGAAISTGYSMADAWGADVTVVMAGDGQMDPAELPALIDPVVEGAVDYTKGNRLIMGNAWEAIPRARLLGNAVLSLLTKVASGYWHIADSQNGYTAISRRALKELLKDGIYPRYGMPNDVLVKLNIHGFAVRDIPMHAVYNVGESSKMKIPHVILPICLLLIRRFLHRLWQRYIVRDTHPLVFFYLLGILLTPLGILYGCLILMVRVIAPGILHTTALELFRPICTASGIVLCAVITLSGLQMLLFAMWFDMQANEHLR